MDVVIYLPRSLDISYLYIHTNDDVILDYETEKEIGSLRINSYGGDVVVNNITTDEINIYKSSPNSESDVSISNIEAHRTSITNYDGSVYIEDYTGVTEDYREPSTLKVYSRASMTISNIDVYEGDFKGYGSTNITEFSGNILSVKNANYDAIILDIDANEVSIESYRGDIIIENLTKFDDDENSVYIEVEDGDIEMVDVYASNVGIYSKKGDIFYHNEDLDYEVELDITMVDTSYDWIKDVDINEKEKTEMSFFI